MSIKILPSTVLKQTHQMIKKMRGMIHVLKGPLAKFKKILFKLLRKVTALIKIVGDNSPRDTEMKSHQAWLGCIRILVAYPHFNGRQDYNRVSKIIVISLRQRTYHYTWKYRYWNITANVIETLKRRKLGKSPQMMIVMIRHTINFSLSKGF